MNFLVKLSESDKRVIFAFLLIFILVFVLIGLIGMLIARLMKWQGKKMDTLVHDVLVAKVVTDKKHLRRYGRKKNWREFFKNASIPFLLIILAFVALLINDIILDDFSYNIFDYKKTGFTTLLFLWDFSEPSIYIKFFGMTIIGDFPPLLNTPHFEVSAIGSYIFAPLFLVGAVWYLIAVQCLIARSYRLYKLVHSVFEKSLDGFRQDDYSKVDPMVIDSAKEELNKEKAAKESAADTETNN
ncbi:MAG: hypothetical protein ACI31G_04180 [Bacilli bacterium]